MTSQNQSQPSHLRRDTVLERIKLKILSTQLPQAQLKSPKRRKNEKIITIFHSFSNFNARFWKIKGKIL